MSGGSGAVLAGQPGLCPPDERGVGVHLQSATDGEGGPLLGRNHWQGQLLQECHAVTTALQPIAVYLPVDLYPEQPRGGNIGVNGVEQYGLFGRGVVVQGAGAAHLVGPVGLWYGLRLT